jgi:chemotaxis protein methyltransferase CheR
LTDRERAIERVLEVAEARFGFGTAGAPPWVRDRAGAFLDAYLGKHGLVWTAIVERVAADRAAMSALVGALRVGETRFLRDPAQWEVIVEQVCTLVPPATPIAALSAGCSTGEEAYTLAMLLTERGRRFEILGVDRSVDAIEHARQGKYAPETVREVPPGLVEQHFEPEAGGLRVRARLRAHVSFVVRDLLLRIPRGPFHVVVFKNVMLYLSEPMGTHVAIRLARELAENGLLFSAASEVVRLSSILDPRRLGPGIIAFRPRREP